MSANSTPYRVDGEFGRFSFPSYRLERAAEVVFDSGRELFPASSGEQSYLTRGFKEIALFYGAVKRPYRETAAVINRLRRVTEATPMRSLREQSQREGAKLQAQIEQKSEAILLAHGVRSEEDGSVKGPSFGRKGSKQKGTSEVAAATRARAAEAEVREEMAANPVPYEEPTQSLNLAVDDLGVKPQKARRKKAGPQESAQRVSEQAQRQEKKPVHRTVAQVETEQGV